VTTPKVLSGPCCDPYKFIPHLHTLFKRFTNCGARPTGEGGAVGHLGVGVVCIKGIFLLKEIRAQDKIYTVF
jgi:hypothetical protein